MTVKELIVMLQALKDDQDTEVYSEGCDCNGPAGWVEAYTFHDGKKIVTIKRGNREL